MRSSNYRLCTIALVAAVLLNASAGQPHAQVVDSEVSAAGIEDIREYLNALVECGEVPGLVAVIAHRDHIVLQEAIGTASQEPARPITSDAIFRLASMTKPLTSAAILLLRDRGQLKLTDPVSKFVPELTNPIVFGKNRLAGTPITIHHLLTHQAGFVYHDSASIGHLYKAAGIQAGVCRSSRSLEDNIRALAKVPLLFEPGTDINYGMSTDVLGLVIERVTGVRLDKFIETEICRPSGMVDTHFVVPDEKKHRVVAAFIEEAGQLRQLGDADSPVLHPIFEVPMSADHPYSPEQRYLSGGGGMSGTATDYLKFCQMIIENGRSRDKRILSPSSIAQMTKNQIGTRTFGELSDGTTYRFGYGLSVLPDESEFEGERGWGGIWGTLFRISVVDEWSAVLLTQRVLDDSYNQREVRFTQLVRNCFTD